MVEIYFVVGEIKRDKLKTNYYYIKSFMLSYSFLASFLDIA